MYHRFCSTIFGEPLFRTMCGNGEWVRHESSTDSPSHIWLSFFWMCCSSVSLMICHRFDFYVCMCACPLCMNFIACIGCYMHKAHTNGWTLRSRPIYALKNVILFFRMSAEASHGRCLFERWIWEPGQETVVRSLSGYTQSSVHMQ